MSSSGDEEKHCLPASAVITFFVVVVILSFDKVICNLSKIRLFPTRRHIGEDGGGKHYGRNLTCFASKTNTI